MKLAEVVPITNSTAQRRTLSYYTTKTVATGALVMVPLQHKEVPGLIVSVSEVRQHKSMLRQSDFALKKITAVLAQSFLTTEFLKAVSRSNEFFLVPSGVLLKQLVPGRILQKGTARSSLDKHSHAHYHASIFQGSSNERMQYYKSLVREAFAEEKSVILLVPTIQDAEYLFQIFQKKI